jgi:hypothetical protein
MQGFLLWTQYWKRHEEEGEKFPSKLLDILDNCDPVIHPTSAKLLTILTTLAVSVATVK